MGHPLSLGYLWPLLPPETARGLPGSPTVVAGQTMQPTSLATFACLLAPAQLTM